MRRPTKFYIETPQKKKTPICNNNCPCAYHTGMWGTAVELRSFPTSALDCGFKPWPL